MNVFNVGFATVGDVRVNLISPEIARAGFSALAISFIQLALYPRPKGRGYKAIRR